MRQYLERMAPLLGGAKRVHLLCADPGALALLGLLEPALREAGLPGAFFTEAWAAGRGDPRGAAFSREALRRAVAEPGRELLLLGARMDFARTRQIVDFCRALGLPTALVLDHWKNYAEHFTGRPGDAGASVLPDWVLVPDDLAREALLAKLEELPPLAAGLPPERVLVLGHPALEASARAIAGADPDAVRALRADLFPDGGPLAVLFLDPVRIEDGYGYGVASVLEFLARWMPEHRPGWSLAVKPHPRQDPPLAAADLEPLARAGVAARLVAGAFEPLAAAADEVWGMTSLALIAAIRAGRPVVSFQPGRTEAGREQSNLHLEGCVIT